MMKTEPAVSYKADLLERLRDPEYATGYLNAVLEKMTKPAPIGFAGCGGSPANAVASDAATMVRDNETASWAAIAA